jgi:hypothetical protein
MFTSVNWGFDSLKYLFYTLPSKTVFLTVKSPTLFRNKYASVSDKIQQEIISKVCNVFFFYHVLLSDM